MAERSITMRPRRTRRTLTFLCFLLMGTNALAFQNARQTKTDNAQDQKSGDVIKIDTSVVAVPVVVSDRNSKYIADLTQDEFSIFEDGVQQQIIFFATTSQPFHVTLVIDTSGSTQEKLASIQRAAKLFVAQLQPEDRTAVSSFDDSVTELSDFTNDRKVLEGAISRTAPGAGTKLYDAVKVALDKLSRVKGRKAMVIFTDGVDYRSDSETYDKNISGIEESGIIVYPIRFETRADTEALIRRQQADYGSAADVGLILGGPPAGTTPPTMPGGSGPSIPQPKPGSPNDPYRLPVPSVILRPPTGGYPGDRRNPNDGRYPDDSRYPDDRSSRMPFPDSRAPGSRDDNRYPDSGSSRGRGRGDSVSVMLDGLYATADQYLNALAVVSGGRLHRADTLQSLPAAFEQIAAELRQQYSLGYSSTNESRDGKYRKIQVKVARKDAVVRSRPGYRAPKAK
jgi:hypothetical protein